MDTRASGNKHTGRATNIHEAIVRIVLTANRLLVAGGYEEN